jgi:hypothetical protein
VVAQLRRSTARSKWAQIEPARPGGGEGLTTREEGAWDGIGRLLTKRGKMAVEPPWCGGAPVMDGQRRWFGELRLNEDSLSDLLTRKRIQGGGLSPAAMVGKIGEPRWRAH